MPISVPGNKRPAEHGFASLRRSAEHGFTPALRSAEHGFTLIELMVVVTIIGLASAAAVLAMPDPRGRLADEGARFAARVRAAQDSAIIEARPVSVWVTSAGYGFDRWQTGGWRAVDEKPLRVERWSDGTGAAVTSRVRLSFDATGMADRAIDVPLRRDRARVTVSVGADGKVRVDG